MTYTNFLLKPFNIYPNFGLKIYHLATLVHTLFLLESMIIEMVAIWKKY
jgi:hypothetical protein